jgi:undecaprenyl-diphosphatase
VPPIFEASILASKSRSLLVLAFASVVAVAALYGLSVHTAVGQRIDEAAIAHRRFMASLDRGRLDAALFLGTLMLAPIDIWLLRRRLAVLVAGAIAALGALGTAELLRQHVLGRPLLTHENPLFGPSFPSGHAAVAMVCAAMFVVGADRLSPRTALFVAQLVTTGVGVLAVSIPIHLPSDILGGFFVGIAWTCGALAFAPPARDPVSLIDAGFATVYVFIASFVFAIAVAQHHAPTAVAKAVAALIAVIAISAGLSLSLFAMALKRATA